MAKIVIISLLWMLLLLNVTQQQSSCQRRYKLTKCNNCAVATNAESSTTCIIENNLPDSITCRVNNASLSIAAAVFPDTYPTNLLFSWKSLQQNTSLDFAIRNNSVFILTNENPFSILRHAINGDLIASSGLFHAVGNAQSLVFHPWLKKFIVTTTKGELFAIPEDLSVAQQIYLDFLYEETIPRPVSLFAPALSSLPILAVPCQTQKQARAVRLVAVNLSSQSAQTVSVINNAAAVDSLAEADNGIVVSGGQQLAKYFYNGSPSWSQSATKGLTIQRVTSSHWLSLGLSGIINLCSESEISFWYSLDDVISVLMDGNLLHTLKQDTRVQVYEVL